jgi:hypothetical protein
VFWRDLLGTCFLLVEEALVQVLSSSEFIRYSFGISSWSVLSEIGVTGLGKRSERFWILASLAKLV